MKKILALIFVCLLATAAKADNDYSGYGGNVLPFLDNTFFIGQTGNAYTHLQLTDGTEDYRLDVNTGNLEVLDVNSAATRLQLDSSGNFSLRTANTSIYWADAASLQTNTIRSGTSDADDDASLCLTGGGACLDTSRGGYIHISGNEAASGGDVNINSGSAPGSNVLVSSNASNGFVGVLTGGGNAVALFTTGGDLVLQQGAAVADAEYTWEDDVALQTNQIRSGTADADDDAILNVCGGGDCASSRGAWISLQGNEYTGAGDLALRAGSASGSDVAISANATNGTVTVTTNSVLGAVFESDGDFALQVISAGIVLRSPDGSFSKCTIDNSDVLSCTGI